MATFAIGASAAQGTTDPADPASGTPTQPPPAQPAQPGPGDEAAGGGGGGDAAGGGGGQKAGAGGSADDEEPGDESDGPPARTGFQIAVRSGAAIPLGEIAKDTNASDAFGPQFAATVDIGGKVIPNLFIGGYLGLNLGGAGGKLSDQCSAANLTCTAVTLRIGIEAQYHIIPDGKINPWVGYGIGFESTSLSASNGGNSSTTSASGPEFAHLMGGVDFRVSKVFGIGPFVDLSVAQYSRFDSGGRSGDIQDKALHQWLTLGAKFTFFP